MNMRCWLVTLAVALGVLFAPRVHAAPICFQKVGGVAGAYNQPPDWWTPTPPLGTATHSYVEDPRWQGATSASDVSDSSRLRVLVETEGSDRFLVLAIRVNGDPTGNADRLYFGIWDDSSHTGNIFSFTKTIGGTSTGAAGQQYSDSAFTARAYSRTLAAANTWGLNAGGTTPPGLPTWLKTFTRLDVCPEGGTCSDWAFRLRIPIKPGADVTADDPPGVNITAGGVYRVWYQIQEASAINTLILHEWPDGPSVAESEIVGSSATCPGIPGYCFPDPLDATHPWQQIQDGGTSCDGEISLRSEQIYANTPGSITVSLSTTNHFHATPTNNRSSAISGDAIKGSFRLANWGSALFDSPAWERICGDVAGSAGTIAGGTNFDIDCSYAVSDPCQYKAVGDGCGTGARNPDQCVLVDLGASATAGPFLFSPQSAWQNMLFNGASTVVKHAAIDARGELPLAVPAPQRDLYVYIDTQNMPRARDPKDPPVNPQRLSGQARELLARYKIRLPESGGIGKETAGAIAEAFSRGALSFADVSQLMPTYVAYVAYDTGKTMLGPTGATLKILKQQPSFGLFLWHDGALYGWRQRFEGSTITELAPNFYLVKAPTNGVVKATVTVTACEKPGCDDAPKPNPTPTPPPTGGHHGWWRWLLFLLVAVVVLVLLFRRKPPSGP